MHAPRLRAAALELHATGMTVAWIARELDVPRRTVAYWLRGGSPGRRRIVIDRRRGEVAKLDSFVGLKR